MNKKLLLTFSLIAVAILIAVIALGCSQAKSDKNTKVAKALYTCPMHPEFVSADPDAKCSLCGMKTEKMTDAQTAAFRSMHSAQMSASETGMAMDTTSSGAAGKCPAMGGSAMPQGKDNASSDNAKP